MRTWQSHRTGQGARTDLTYPDPHGQPVFINPTTITTTTLLCDLAKLPRRDHSPISPATTLDTAIP